jgi:4-hydroxy-3-polyprenylbenzoate decarboxylase
MSNRHLALAITGASGSTYGVQLAGELLKSCDRLTILLSKAGATVLKYECGIDWEGDEATVTRRMREYFQVDADRLHHYAVDNLFAPIASGSSAPDSMVICPCSMGTLGRIAAGISGTLIERSADVMLKERRPLILVPRETPLHDIHLENMLKLSRMGVRIVPAMPAFYHGPRTMQDLVDFVVGKVLDSLGIEHQLFTRWGAGCEE